MQPSSSNRSTTLLGNERTLLSIDPRTHSPATTHSTSRLHGRAGLTTAATMTGEAEDGHVQPRHIELVTDEAIDAKNGDGGSGSSPVLTNGKGWDGKLRIPGKVALANPEALSDPEYSDEENVVEGEQIQADEGMYYRVCVASTFAAVCLSCLGATRRYT